MSRPCFGTSNVACGRCRTCRRKATPICSFNQTSGPARLRPMSISALGGGRRSTSCSLRRLNLLRFPYRAARAKILDLTMLTDNCRPASTERSPRASRPDRQCSRWRGPVASRPPPPRACSRGGRHDRRLQQGRLEHAKSVGFEPVNLSGTPARERISEILKFRGRCLHRLRRLRSKATRMDQPALCADQAMEVTRPTGATVFQSLCHEDPAPKKSFQTGFAEPAPRPRVVEVAQLSTGQTPVLGITVSCCSNPVEPLPIAKIVNAKVSASMPHPRVAAFDSGWRTNSSSIRMAACPGGDIVDRSATLRAEQAKEHRMSLIVEGWQSPDSRVRVRSPRWCEIRLRRCSSSL